MVHRHLRAHQHDQSGEASTSESRITSLARAPGGAILPDLGRSAYAKLSALNQAEKGGALGGARSTPDDNDDSVMLLDLREPEEIIFYCR